MLRPALSLRGGNAPARSRTQLAPNRFTGSASGIACGRFSAFQLPFDLPDLLVDLIAFVLVSNQRHLERSQIFCGSSSWHWFSPAHYNNLAEDLSISKYIDKSILRQKQICASSFSG